MYYYGHHIRDFGNLGRNRAASLDAGTRATIGRRCAEKTRPPQERK